MDERKVYWKWDWEAGNEEAQNRLWAIKKHLIWKPNSTFYSLRRLLGDLLVFEALSHFISRIFQILFLENLENAVFPDCEPKLKPLLLALQRRKLNFCCYCRPWFCFLRAWWSLLASNSFSVGQKSLPVPKKAWHLCLVVCHCSDRPEVCLLGVGHRGSRHLVLNTDKLSTNVLLWAQTSEAAWFASPGWSRVSSVPK